MGRTALECIDSLSCTACVPCLNPQLQGGGGGACWMGGGAACSKWLDQPWTQLWLRGVLYSSLFQSSELVIFTVLTFCLCFARNTVVLCVSGGNFFSDSFCRLLRYTSRWQHTIVCSWIYQCFWTNWFIEWFNDSLEQVTRINKWSTFVCHWIIYSISLFWNEGWNSILPYYTMDTLLSHGTKQVNFFMIHWMIYSTDSFKTQIHLGTKQWLAACKITLYTLINYSLLYSTNIVARCWVYIPCTLITEVNFGNKWVHMIILFVDTTTNSCSFK